MVIELSVLIEVLPVLARISGGYATVTDREGIRIKTFDSNGNEVRELVGVQYSMAKEAGLTGKIQSGFSEIVKSAEAWALPLGDYVLATSNVERIQRDKELKESIKTALPFIARVAGGEAVLFDSSGKRLASVDHNGEVNPDFIGSVSNAALRAMQEQKTVIGESMSVSGAVGVRIPITEDFGFGFNNEQSVKREHKLLEEVKKYQYAKYNFNDIVGESEEIKKVKKIGSFVAQGLSSVLITGETGTGKELFAQAIHNSSERRAKPFVAVNCTAIPSSLIESYLFGYVEGAFTGAKKGGSLGCFEQAEGGTIFLDEVSEMEYGLQSKLLRVLQEREVTRIGGSANTKVDVRVIAATNKDLITEIKKGRFREDLFYRLNVVQLNIPPLRRREKDIPLLIKFFINKYNKTLEKFILEIDQEALNIMLSYEWPGNVRQLQNCVEYAMNMVGINESEIAVQHLPTYLFEDNPELMKSKYLTLKETIRIAEKEAILKALVHYNNSKIKVAQVLGISTTSLWRKMTEYKIDV